MCQNNKNKEKNTLLSTTSWPDLKEYWPVAGINCLPEENTIKEMKIKERIRK